MSLKFIQSVVQLRYSLHEKRSSFHHEYDGHISTRKVPIIISTHVSHIFVIICMFSTAVSATSVLIQSVRDNQKLHIVLKIQGASEQWRPMSCISALWQTMYWRGTHHDVEYDLFSFNLDYSHADSYAMSPLDSLLGNSIGCLIVPKSTSNWHVTYKYNPAPSVARFSYFSLLYVWRTMNSHRCYAGKLNIKN